MSILTILWLVILSCSDNAEDSTTISESNVDITSVVQSSLSNTYTNNVTVQVNANSITIKSTGLPDHKTPYWGEGHEM